MWKGKRSSLRHIKIWGCEVFVRREAQDKLEARSEKCLFIGYLEESFGYLFYKPNDNVVFLAQRGELLEREMISKEDSRKVVTPVKPDDISLPIHIISSRVSKPSQDPQFYYGFHIEKDKISNSTLTELNELANYKEAMAILEAAKWKEAMKREIQSMLVAKCYTQTHGIDYEETFSPVVKIKSIRIMLAITSFHDYEIWQMDIKTAFLNGKLIEDVFMAQLEGFENQKYPKRVCKLQKAIYGLKQASRRNGIPMLQRVKDWLGRCFALKDLGDATYILGIKIYRDRTKHLIGLSQDTYLDKILKRFRMENSTKGNLPFHHGIKISKDLCLKTNDELDKMSRVPYDSAIGSIMYLRNTKDRFLVYGGEKELRVTGYCDAGRQTDKDDIRSLSGWIFLLNRGVVTWKSLKQDTVADSTCESEYIAACEASKEAIWMKNFIRDLGVVPTI
ncbi:putative RNA-directed DNA polymerase [Tanacetum coccineum]